MDHASQRDSELTNEPCSESRSESRSAQQSGLPYPDAELGSASELTNLLKHTIHSKASDLHLRRDEPPFIRAGGRLQRIANADPLTAETMRRFAEELVGSMGLKRLDSHGSIDGAFTGPEQGRFRFNIFRQQNQISIALRLLDEQVRSLEELGLPDSLYQLSELIDGLIVVAGPTGAGKSTTLATLIDRINQTRDEHIVTIEDPIEYLHPPARSLVNQRQIGIDAGSFQEALVAALRQDPDVILVGEIRDLNTIRTAITAAETGHLVFTTVHAGSAVGVIERLISVFPADEQTGMRRQLSLVLKAVVAQQLIVADGRRAAAPGRRKPRVVASEVMRVNSAIANLIANGKSAQISSAIESGSSAGMQTLDQDLARLVSEGELTLRSALALARNPTIVQQRLQGGHFHRSAAELSQQRHRAGNPDRAGNPGATT